MPKNKDKSGRPAPGSQTTPRPARERVARTANRANTDLTVLTDSLSCAQLLKSEGESGESHQGPPGDGNRINEH